MVNSLGDAIGKNAKFGVFPQTRHLETSGYRLARRHAVAQPFTQHFEPSLDPFFDALPLQHGLGNKIGCGRLQLLNSASLSMAAARSDFARIAPFDIGPAGGHLRVLSDVALRHLQTEVPEMVRQHFDRRTLVAVEVQHGEEAPKLMSQP